MESEIFLTSESVNQQATNAEDAAKKLEDISSHLKTIQENLKEVWKGEAADAFQASCPERITDLNHCQESLEKLASNLKVSIGKLNEGDEQAKNTWFR